MPIYDCDYSQEKGISYHCGLLQCQNRGDPTSVVVIHLNRFRGSVYKRRETASLDSVDRRAWSRWPKYSIYIAIKGFEEAKDAPEDYFFIRKPDGLTIDAMDSSKLGLEVPLGNVRSWTCGEKKLVKSVLVSSGDHRVWLTLTARKMYAERSTYHIIWANYSFAHQDPSNPSQIAKAHTDASTRLLRVDGGAFYAELSNQAIFGKRAFLVDVLFLPSTEAICNLWFRTRLRYALEFALACIGRLCPQPLLQAASMLGTKVVDFCFDLAHLVWSDWSDERGEHPVTLLAIAMFFLTQFGREMVPRFINHVVATFESNWFIEMMIPTWKSLVIAGFAAGALSMSILRFSFRLGVPYQPCGIGFKLSYELERSIVRFHRGLLVWAVACLVFFISIYGRY
jgi:hypothetical protein